MQFNDFLAKLQGVKGNGGQYNALCPAHADKEPSLSVSQKDGKILLHCHTGCDKESILGALGLELPSSFCIAKLTRAPMKSLIAWHSFSAISFTSSRNYLHLHLCTTRNTDNTSATVTPAPLNLEN